MSQHANPRHDVEQLIAGLRTACRRPLFEEIVHFDSSLNTELYSNLGLSTTATTTTSMSAPKRMDSYESWNNHAEDETPVSWEKLSWAELLHEASLRAIYLTDDEHKQVLHYASILFLGFLLPHSTGNEFVLLQNVQRKSKKSSSSSSSSDNNEIKQTFFDPVECVLEMTLTERLGQIATQIPAIQQNTHSSYELNAVTDPKVELAYHHFLERGLKPLLSARTIHREEVDILHLIAMVICPWATPTKKRNLSPMAQALVKHPLATAFAVHHGHRVEWVEFLAAQVIRLPSLSEEADSYNVTKPLLQGALPHLQGSLLAFAARSTLPHASSLAYAAWTATVVQTRNLALLAQLWHSLLQQIVENPAKDGNCQHDSFPRRANRQFWPLTKKSPKLKENNPINNVDCHLFVCGQLLAGIFLHGTNRADFADMALSSLSDAIEWQMDAWAKDEDEPDKKPPTTPCLLAALLFAVRNILLVTNQDDLEEEAVDTLVTSAIQLLFHPQRMIRQEATRMLEEAFAHKLRKVSYARLLLESIKRAKATELLEGISHVVKHLVKASPGFAKELSSYIVDKMKSPDGLSESDAQILETIALNNPRFLKEQYESVLNQLTKEGIPHTIAMRLISTMLSKRQTFYFASPETEKDSLQLQSILSSKGNRWDQYRMASHSMAVGDFCFAALAFKSIANSPTSEHHFLWLSALEKIATAEAMLTLHGSKAIPDASCHLHEALSHLHHLESTGSIKTSTSFAFQTRYLFLRLDELDWITVIRQITRETRLTGASPSKNTRHYQHLINAEKGLITLGSRFSEMNQQFGVSFKSGRSTTSLLSHAYFCNFLSKATHSAFCDIFSAQKVQTGANQRMSKSDLPMIKLLNELDGIIVQPMNTPMEPTVRAAAMLELLDGALMVPTSFPEDFFSPRSNPVAHIGLSSDPSELFELGGKTSTTIECHPSICFNVHVHGKIPLHGLQSSRRPIVRALLWCHFVYSSHRKYDEEVDGIDRTVIEGALPQITKPMEIPILADGRFQELFEMPPMSHEGCFALHVKLGCRDSSGDEFELFTMPSSPQIAIHCSRSR